MNPVRFGLTGYGFGGRYFHAPLIASAAECELSAVMTSSPQRQALVRQEHPGVPTVSTLRELRELGVEAVSISTPAATHTALTEQALNLGLAVVSDKPFALDAHAARGTVDLAEGLGLALTAFQNRRWDSDFLTVRNLVDDGALGRAGWQQVNISRSRSSSIPLSSLSAASSLVRGMTSSLSFASPTVARRSRSSARLRALVFSQATVHKTERSFGEKLRTTGKDAP